jgi:hypothetical protein
MGSKIAPRKYLQQRSEGFEMLRKASKCFKGLQWGKRFKWLQNAGSLKQLQGPKHTPN